MLTCTPENATKFLDWLKGRGGIAIWKSANLSNPGASWSTPALQENGGPTTKPTWEASGTPEIITDVAEVIVLTFKEVKRFRVGVKQKGMGLRVTAAGTRRINAACAKAGADAFYDFDYSTQEAVIKVPDLRISLVEFVQNLN